MVKFQTPLKQTVTLVERRVRDNRSEDPIKDLAFLSEHYRSNHEWDKASAATRHMLAVAEGRTTSVFEITPIDIELQQSKQHLRRRFRSRFWLTITILLSVAGGTSFAASQFKIDQKFVLDLKTQMFPFDPQNFIDRASFFDSSNKFKEALDDYDKALILDPKNSAALQHKSSVLFEMGDLQQAWQANELSSRSNAYYFYNKRRIEEARGDFAAAALSQAKADTIRPCSNNKAFIGYEYARAGDFAKALQFAEQATDTAQADFERVWGFVTEARYNLRLARYQEAIEAASKAIDYDDNQHFAEPISTAYALRAEAEHQLALNEKAVYDASKAIGLDSRNYRAYNVRAKIFESMGRTDDAQADLRSAEYYRNWKDM